MDLELTTEQELVIESARDLLSRACPPALVRELREVESTGHSDKLWLQLAEFGWLGLVFDPNYGGGGGSLFDLGLFYEQAGRALLPTSFYSTIAAGLVISELGTRTQQEQLLTRIVSGDAVCSVAISEPAALHDPGWFTTSARETSGRWRLTGTKAFVANGHLADPLITLARTSPGAQGDGITAFLVPKDSPGVTVVPQRTFGHDKQSIVEFNDVVLDPDAVLGGEVMVDRAWPSTGKAIQQATARQCMEMVGGAEKVIETTADYVKNRVQFGVPIGKFQAVQHQMADMCIALDAARITSYQALWRLSEGLPADRELGIAKARASASYSAITVVAHQLHGGAGLVVENDLHMWSERAKATELSLGNPDFHLKRVASAMGL